MSAESRPAAAAAAASWPLVRGAGSGDRPGLSSFGVVGLVGEGDDAGWQWGCGDELQLGGPLVAMTGRSPARDGARDRIRDGATPPWLARSPESRAGSGPRRGRPRSGRFSGDDAVTGHPLMSAESRPAAAAAAASWPLVRGAGSGDRPGLSSFGVVGLVGEGDDAGWQWGCGDELQLGGPLVAMTGRSPGE